MMAPTGCWRDFLLSDYGFGSMDWTSGEQDLLAASVYECLSLAGEVQNNGSDLEWQFLGFRHRALLVWT